MMNDNPVMIVKKKFTKQEIKELEELIKNSPAGVLPVDSFSQIEVLREELEHASKYIQENEVIHKKVKKDIPTVIEYQGRRYTLAHGDQYRK